MGVGVLEVLVLVVGRGVVLVPVTEGLVLTLGTPVGGVITDALMVGCVEGIVPDVERMEYNLNNSLMLVTCLTPKIGYEAAAKCAKRALSDGITLKEAVLALGLLTAEEFDETVRPEKMV